MRQSRYSYVHLRMQYLITLNNGKNVPALEDGDVSVEIYVKDLKVKIWVEKSLLFALTDVPETRRTE